MFLTNIIGAGKLGKSLALKMIEANLIKLIGITNNTLNSAKKASFVIGCGKGYLINDLPKAELIIISTNDCEIMGTCL